MPQDKGYTNIVANTTVNVMEGRLFQRVGGRPAMLKLYACGLTGAAGALTATFIAGSDVINLDVGLRPLAAGPVVPDDAIGSGPGLPGDPIQINVTNTTGADIVCGWLIDVENM